MAFYWGQTMDRLKDCDYLMALYRLYGGLLTAREAAAVRDYLGYDLSLGEIADSEHITRSAVLDAVKKGGAKLRDYESKLRLYEKYSDLKAAVASIEAVEDEHSRLALYQSLGKALTYGI